MRTFARFTLVGLAVITLAGAAEAMPIASQSAGPTAARAPIVEAAIVVVRRRPRRRVIVKRVVRPRVVIKKIIR